MTALSTSLISHNKPKLRFSIDALMGKVTNDDDPPFCRDDASPVSVKDYRVPKLHPDLPESRSSHPNVPRSPKPPVIVPVPTFPGGLSGAPPTVRSVFGARERANAYNSPLYQQTLHQVSTSGVEQAFPGILFQRESFPGYPWYFHRQRFLHRFPGPDITGYLLPPFRKAKRIRTAFSASQLMKLEGAFDKNHYVTGNERKQLAEGLGLTETQVKVWFQNRRTKQKRQIVENKERNEKSQRISINKGTESQHCQSTEANSILSTHDRMHHLSSYDDEDSDTSFNSDDKCPEKTP